MYGFWKVQMFNNSKNSMSKLHWNQTSSVFFFFLQVFKIDIICFLSRVLFGYFNHWLHCFYANALFVFVNKLVHVDIKVKYSRSAANQFQEILYIITSKWTILHHPHQILKFLKQFKSKIILNTVYVIFIFSSYLTQIE